MRADGQMPNRSKDRVLWQRSRETDAAEDEAERFLDLAAFADGRLDAEESERVGELLARDPAVAADVAAAQTLAAASLPPLPDGVFERASEMVGGGDSPGGQILAFPQRRWGATNLQGLARWGSLAAAIVVAGWLGFALGSDTSTALNRVGPQNEDGFLRELLDPSSGFLRDLTEGVQT